MGAPVDGVYDQLAARALDLMQADRVTRQDLLSFGPIISYTQEINRLLREARIGR